MIGVLFGEGLMHGDTTCLWYARCLFCVVGGGWKGSVLNHVQLVTSALFFLFHLEVNSSNATSEPLGMLVLFFTPGQGRQRNVVILLKGMCFSWVINDKTAAFWKTFIS